MREEEKSGMLVIYMYSIVCMNGSDRSMESTGELY
jgi:hypothetical protein